MSAHLMLGALAIGGWATWAATALESMRRAARRREAAAIRAELDDLPY